MPRCESSNQFIISMALFSTKRPASGGWLSRNSNRSRAKRVRTRSRLPPLALANCSRQARTEAQQIDPTGENGLSERAYAMSEKITAIPKGNLGRQIGQLDESRLKLIGAAIRQVMGL